MNALMAKCQEFCSRGDIEGLDALIKENKRDALTIVSSAGNLGNTAIHWAASAGHEDIVGYLIDLGIHVNVGNDIYDTPLHLAASKGQAETCRLLLKRGADASLVNQDGKTPLEIARGDQTKAALALVPFEQQITFADSAEDSDDE